MQTIELKMHPAVVKWIDATFPKVDNAYDLRKDALYILFYSSLMQKKIKPPLKPLKKIEKHIPIRIHINEWEFYRYGWDIPNHIQAMISNFLFSMMMNKICEHIAYAFAYGKISRDITIRRIMIEYLFDDEEINYYYIRKWYQRKYQDTNKENEIIDFVKNTLIYSTQN